MRKIIKNKRGNILTENIIFLILNLVFISILLLFVFSRVDNAAVLEEKYAKQIALIIDSSEPVMAITLEMIDAVESASSNGISPEEIISINENIITVNLRDERGYSYSFFNDVDVSINYEDPDKYVIFIEENE